MTAFSLILVLLLAQPDRNTSVVGTTRPASADMELAEPYVDGNEEYSIRPPRGWRLARQRMPEPRGIRLLRIIGPPVGIQDQEIVVRREVTSAPQPIEERLKNAGASMGLEFSDVRLGTQQVQPIAGRPGGVLSATYSHDGLRWIRVHALIEWGADEYLTLTYSGPVELARESESLIQWMLASLRFLPRYLKDEELRQAIDNGKTWQQGVEGTDLRKVMNTRQFFRVEHDGRTNGFVALEESEFVLNRVAGVRLAERGWVFEPDGRVRSIDNAIFLGNDMMEERWRATLTTWTPAAGERPDFLERTIEEAARVKDTLVTSQSYVYGQPATANPALKLPPSYLPRLMVRFLPRLVKDLAKPRRMAFTTFDHARADLVVRIVELKGEASSAERVTSTGQCYLIEEREGLASEPTRAIVDAKGRVLLIEAGPICMKPADEKELEQLLGARIAEADRRISELERSYEKEMQRFGRPETGP